MSISRGRDRGRFPLRQGGADAVGWSPNKEATKSAGSRLERRERGGPTGRGAGAPSTTPHEGKSARSRRVGKDLCSYAAFDDCLGHPIGELGRPCIRSPAQRLCCVPIPPASEAYTA